MVRQRVAGDPCRRWRWGLSGGCAAFVDGAAAQAREVQGGRHVVLIERADVGPGRDDLVDPVQDVVAEHDVEVVVEV